MTTYTGGIPTVTPGTTTLLSTYLGQYAGALRALSDPLTSYTPTWVGSTTNPAIGNGTLVGKYARIGQGYCFFRVAMTAGTTTTVGSGSYSFALPAAAHGSGEQTVTADFYDGSSHYAATGLIAPGGTVVVPVSTKGGTSGSQVTLGSTSFSAGASALIVCQGIIELA